MQLEYFLVSESVSIDQSTNRLSIFHVLEELSLIDPASAMIGSRLQQIVLASSWNAEPADIGQTFRVSSRASIPGRQEPFEIGEIEFVAERKRQRLLQMVMGLQASEAGDIVFEVLLNGERRASHSVSISRAPLGEVGNGQVPSN